MSASSSKRPRASLESDKPLQPYTKQQEREWTRRFPWAVYHGVGSTARNSDVQRHLWTCSVCGPENQPQKFVFKDADAFRGHAKSASHVKKQARVNEAQNMQKSLTAMRHKADEQAQGFNCRCLLIVAWLVLTNKTLQTFSQVCILNTVPVLAFDVRTRLAVESARPCMPQ